MWARCTSSARPVSTTTAAPTTRRCVSCKLAAFAAHKFNVTGVLMWALCKCQGSCTVFSESRQLQAPRGSRCVAGVREGIASVIIYHSPLSTQEKLTHSYHCNTCAHTHPQMQWLATDLAKADANRANVCCCRFMPAVVSSSEAWLPSPVAPPLVSPTVSLVAHFAPLCCIRAGTRTACA
jgi:hypothetical protein